MANSVPPAASDPPDRAAAVTIRTASKGSVPVGASRIARWGRPGGLLLVFAVVTWQVLAAGWLVTADRVVRRWVLGAAVTPVGRTITPGEHVLADLADWQVAVPVLAVVAGLVAVRRRSVRPVLVAAVSGGVALAAVSWLKDVLGRPGPFTPTGATGLGFYPSGHTVTALVCFGCAAYLVGGLLSRFVARLVVAGTTVLCALIGAALVWCDYHWLSDVLGGAAFGGLVLCALPVLSGTVRHG